MEDNGTCGCQAAPKLIFACAGASDTADITYRAARRLTREGAGKMYCLAGIGGRVQDILNISAEAEILLALDGCEADCAKRSLELAGFSNVLHLRVTDLGMPKGSSPATLERISQVVAAAKSLLNDKSIVEAFNR